jgi:hypothetical protein
VEVPVLRPPELTFSLLLGFSLSAAALCSAQNAQTNQNSASAAGQQGHDNRGASQTVPSLGAPLPPALSDRAETFPRDHAGKPDALAPQPTTSDNGVSAPAATAGVATLKISIRTPDDSPFSGVTSLHLVSGVGAEVAGKNSDIEEGQTEYSDLRPGAYTMEASAPGFAPIMQTVEIESGKRTQTIFLIMRPAVPASDAKSPKINAHTTGADATNSVAVEPAPSPPIGWSPPGVDSFLPQVAPDVSCPLTTVLAGVSERMKQFVANLQKFSATEHIEHYPIDVTGKRLIPQTRKFDYVAVVTPLSGGLFSLDEYRNGGLDRTRFPANVATEGLPAMALIFHPALSSDFKFDCEGLGTWHARPAWLVHFVQRSDRTSRLGGYRTQDHYYPWDFKGRAWIDAGSYQVLRLQMELAKPISAVGLTAQLVIIDYAVVTFHSRKQQLWLPQSAEIYMERHSQRFYRIHTFTDFKIYTVETDQSIHAPKESYCFTNTTDHDIAGVLTVSPVSGISLKAVSVQFIVPPGKSVYKFVGPGKDINMPVSEVGSATFTHNGPADAIKADAYLVKESTLDVIADTPVSLNP